MKISILSFIGNQPCIHWLEISITCTGKVSFCCMDGKCQRPIGGVKTHGVLKIHHRAAYRSLRERGTARRHVLPCQECTYL